MKQLGEWDNRICVSLLNAIILEVVGSLKVYYQK